MIPEDRERLREVFRKASDDVLLKQLTSSENDFDAGVYDLMLDEARRRNLLVSARPPGSQLDSLSAADARVNMLLNELRGKPARAVISRLMLAARLAGAAIRASPKRRAQALRGALSDFALALVVLAAFAAFFYTQTVDSPVAQLLGTLVQLFLSIGGGGSQ